jgi:hypothetical protein
MPELHLIRKRCPHCGKAMKLVPDETGRGDTSVPPARRIRCTTPPPKNGRTARCARRPSSLRRIRPAEAVGHPLPATGLAGSSPAHQLL